MGERPVIVVGCPRSGTTMLQLMLHAHPRIAIPPETRFVLEGYRDRRQFGDLRQAENRRRLASWITDREQSRFSDLGLDPAAVTAAITNGPPTLGAAMGSVFRAYANRFGKPRWGDKRPAYIDNLDVVLQLFPDAQIVSILRDGRDCVASLKEMPWHRGGVPEAVSAWARAVDRSTEAAAALGPDTFHQLRYEELVADPHTQLRQLCEFLDEPYDPIMAEPAAVAPVAVPAHKTWHERTHGAVSADRVRSWRTRLTPAEIGLCEAMLGSRLARHGYPPAELAATRAPGAPQLVRYGLVSARHDLGRLRRAVRRELERRRQPPADATANPAEQAGSPSLKLTTHS